MEELLTLLNDKIQSTKTTEEEKAIYRRIEQMLEENKSLNDNQISRLKKIIETPVILNDGELDKLQASEYKERLIKLLLATVKNDEIFDTICQTFEPDTDDELLTFTKENIDYYFKTFEELLKKEDIQRLLCILYLLQESSVSIRLCDTRNIEEYFSNENLKPIYDQTLLQKHHQKERMLIEKVKTVNAPELISAVCDFYGKLIELINSERRSDVSCMVPTEYLMVFLYNIFMNEDSSKQVISFLNSFFDPLTLRNVTTIAANKKELERYSIITGLSTKEQRDYGFKMAEAQPPIPFIDAMLDCLETNSKIGSTELFSLRQIKKILDSDSTTRYNCVYFYPIPEDEDTHLFPVSIATIKLKDLIGEMTDEELAACLKANGYEDFPSYETKIKVFVGLNRYFWLERSLYDKRSLPVRCKEYPLWMRRFIQK